LGTLLLSVLCWFAAASAAVLAVHGAAGALAAVILFRLTSKSKPDVGARQTFVQHGELHCHSSVLP